MKNIIVGLIVLSSLLLTTVNAKSQLTATIIGSGSPIYNEDRASASTLISAGDTHILVDMGNGTQANLHKLGIDIGNLSSLFFTHHHLDHNEEFVPIFIRSLLGKGNFSIIGPPATTKLAEVNLALYEEDISYRLGKTQRSLSERKNAFKVTDMQGGESFNINDIQVTTLKVPHTIHTLAYRFDYHGQSIVITGDLTYSDELPMFAKNADVMIIDAGGMVMTGDKKKGKAKKKEANNKSSRVHAHLDLADSSLLAKQSNVKNLVYTHFNKGTVDNQASLHEIRKNYTGKVIFAKDLMLLNASEQTDGVTIAKMTNTYQVVDTGQRKAYSNDKVITLPLTEDEFFGQDASYISNPPSYTDHHDGTVTDNVTGLMWQQDMGEKLSYDDALQKVHNNKLAGYSDWRIATIKELYSLIQFSGSVKGQHAISPFIDTRYFKQPLGDSAIGEREIDAQTWSSTEYVSKTMNKDDTVFGVNFVDGRIKAYPKYNPRSHEANKMYFRLVRGNEQYGKNQFVDNADGTISDVATGLMWQQDDSHEGLNWQDALNYANYANNAHLADHDDWRLPNAKELQSIVDYSRSPETSESAAIDPIFNASSINNEKGEKGYPYYWSSTTHLDGLVPEAGAVYLAFGQALGEMHGNVMDVHGAGAQRSDPKTGQAMSRGPQGDIIRVKNYVRLVRGGGVRLATDVLFEDMNEYTQKTSAQSGVANKPRLSSHNKFMNRLDKNADGKITISEFKKGERRFKHLDKNNDGYITDDEAPTKPPKTSD